MKRDLSLAIAAVVGIVDHFVVMYYGTVDFMVDLCNFEYCYLLFVFNFV